MNNTLRVILGAIITLALAWVIFSLLLQWARPSLYSASGTVNWWTTLWVTIVTVLILWIVLFILYFLTNGNDTCCDIGTYNTTAGTHYNTAAGTNYNTAAGTNYNTGTGANYNNAAGTNYNAAGTNYNTWSLW